MRLSRVPLGVLALAVLAACEVNTCNTTTTSPTPVVVVPPAPTPSPTATPVSTSGCNLVWAVKIAQGGASCVPGSGLTLAVGCVLDVTATPLGVELEPLPISVHGPLVAWSGSGQVVSVDQRGDNPFNKAIRALAPGEWTVTATNCARVGELRGSVVK